jgi:hypothetical protein
LYFQACQGRVYRSSARIPTFLNEDRDSGMPRISAPPGVSGAVAWLLATLIVVAAALLIGRTVWLLDRGFDFTDQSFYLMSIQRPADYKLAYGLWPYALHPLYELAGASAATLQRLGALILVAFGLATGLVILNRAKLNWRQASGMQIVVVCAALPLSYYTLWIPTPSYNWFALIGGLALFNAILLLHQPASTKASAVWAAIAGSLAIFSRPHNAIAYGALYLLATAFVLPTMQARMTQIAWAAGTTVLAGLAVALFLPVGVIISQIREYNAIFGMSHPVQYSFMDEQWKFWVDAKAWRLAPIVFAVVMFMRRGGRRIPRSLTIVLVAIALAGVLVALLGQGSSKSGIRAAVIAFAALTLAGLKKTIDGQSIKLLAVATLIPWAATLGSANPIHPQLALFVGLWIAVAFACFILAVQNTDIAITAASAIALGVSFLDINLGFASPYRLAGSLATQMVPTQIGWGSELKLDGKTSAFITTLRDTARQGGFCKGGTAIDLSGALPGAVFAIDGQMPIFPWLFGGYSFSNHFAEEYLKQLGPERLRQSWLITGSSGSFSIEELSALGVRFSAYRLVAELNHPLDDSLIKVYAPLDRTDCPRVTR